METIHNKPGAIESNRMESGVQEMPFKVSNEVSQKAEPHIVNENAYND